MRARNLWVCIGIIGLQFGCAAQRPVETPQMLVKENAGLVENSAENIAKPPPPPAPEKMAEKSPAVNGKAMSCRVKGDPVTLDNLQVGITIQVGYCDSNLQPEGSKFWIPEAEAPALGNISVDDPCNITYCPTTPHYDHFGITDGKRTVQVQVKWEGNQAVIYQPTVGE